jgi:hypothetical protein
MLHGTLRHILFEKAPTKKLEEVFFGQIFLEFTRRGTTSSTYAWRNNSAN